MEQSLRTGWPCLMQSRYSARIKQLLGSDLTAYWPLRETSGSAIEDISGNGCHGAYTGVDLISTPGPIVGKVPYFDGVNDLGNIFVPNLASRFNGSEGTLMLWVKVSAAGDWEDGVQRTGINIGSDANNNIMLRKNANGSSFFGGYLAGGVAKYPGGGYCGLEWGHFAITWSKSADKVIGYMYGKNPSTLTGLGNWTGALDTLKTGLGSTRSTTPLNPWKGWLADVVLMARPITPTELSIVYNRR